MVITELVVVITRIIKVNTITVITITAIIIINMPAIKIKMQPSIAVIVKLATMLNEISSMH